MMDFLIANPIALIAFAGLIWFGVQFLFALAVRPYRKKLEAGLKWLGQSPNLSDGERDFLEHMWKTATSVRASMLLCLVYLEALLMSREAIERERKIAWEAAPNFWHDQKIDDLMDWHFISIFAANPIFGLFALFLRLAWWAKLAAYIYRDFRSAADSEKLYGLPSYEAAIRS